MSTEILVPKLGFNSEEGEINQWLVADGSEVTAGEPLLLIESDKSSMEIEAPQSGRLTVLVEAGQTRPVGTVIGRID